MVIPLPRGVDRGTPQRRLAGPDLALDDEECGPGGDVVEERSQSRDFGVAAKESVDLRPFHDRPESSTGVHAALRRNAARPKVAKRLWVPLMEPQAVGRYGRNHGRYATCAYRKATGPSGNPATARHPRQESLNARREQHDASTCR